MFLKDAQSFWLVIVGHTVVGIPATHPHIGQISTNGSCIHAAGITLCFPVTENLVIAAIGLNADGCCDACLPMVVTVKVEVGKSHRLDVLPEMHAPINVFAEQADREENIMVEQHLSAHQQEARAYLQLLCSH